MPYFRAALQNLLVLQERGSCCPVRGGNLPGSVVHINLIKWWEQIPPRGSLSSVAEKAGPVNAGAQWSGNSIYSMYLCCLALSTFLCNKI